MSSYISKTQHLVLIIWLAAFAAFALIGFRDFLTNLEENRCDMTWMYEWPRYIKVPLWKGTAKRFPKYALYLYGEGEYADRSKGLKLFGIPVLFIPGNAGSYKQARSLASVALRKAESLTSKVHFNYFTADLDESLSGLFGGVLYEQTEFIRICVTRILWLYKKIENPPTSVVLVGHSMGGLIARGLFTLPKFEPSVVHTIITFGTPHRHPVLSLDPQLMDYYETVNSFWRSQAFSNDTEKRLENITLVSVSGGLRDVLVRSSSSSMNHLASQSQAISLVTTSVPKVWLSIDHLCLCWCRQLVLVTNRALFDMIDPRNRQIMENKQHRMKIFQHYFVKNPGQSAVTLSNTSNVLIKRTDKDFGLVSRKRLWRFKGNGQTVIEQNFYLFSKKEWSATHDYLMIMTTIDSDQWLYGCQEVSGQACTNISSLSHLAELLPWGGSTMKYAKLDLNHFPGIAYFAVSIPSSRKSTIVWSEYQSSSGIEYNVELPGVLSKRSKVLDIASASLFANITLKSVVKSWKVYIFDIEPIDCDTRTSVLIARIHVPWFNEDVYNFSSNSSTKLVLKLHHPKPKGNKHHVQMHLWLDPKCSYRVSAQYDFYQTLGQIYRFYAVQLFCWIFTIVLLVFAWQLSSISIEEQCKSFFSLISNVSKSLRVLLLVAQSHFFVSQFVLAFFLLNGESGQHSWLPNIDDLKTFVWLLPLVVIISTAVIIVIALFVWIGLFVRFGGLILSHFKWSLYVHTGVGGKDWICGTVIIIISLLFCGTLSLILVFMLCLWRTWKYGASVKICESQLPGQRNHRQITTMESLENFGLTLCVLNLLLIIINCPALAVWAKNLTFSYHLQSDHTTLISIIIGVNMIGFQPLIKVPRSLVYLCFITSIAVTQAAIIPLHMIPYTVCFLFTVLNVSQFVGRFKRQKED